MEVRLSSRVCPLPASSLVAHPQEAPLLQGGQGGPCSSAHKYPQTLSPKQRGNLLWQSCTFPAGNQARPKYCPVLNLYSTAAGVTAKALHYRKSPPTPHLFIWSDKKISDKKLLFLIAAYTDLIKPAAGDLVQVADGDGGEEDVAEGLGGGLQLDGGAGGEEVCGVLVDEVEARELAQDDHNCPEAAVTGTPGRWGDGGVARSSWGVNEWTDNHTFP